MWESKARMDMNVVSLETLEKLDLLIGECPTYINAVCRWLFDDEAPMSDLAEIDTHYKDDDLEWLANYNN